MDREKVIKGLKCCGYGIYIDPCDLCPYNYDGDEGENKCLREQLIPDALELIETQHKLICELQNIISIGTKMMNGSEA